MPKKGIHPEMYDVEIVFPKSKDGKDSITPDVIKTKSTSNMPITAEIRLDNHPAWQKDKSSVIINAKSESQKNFIQSAAALFGDDE